MRFPCDVRKNLVSPADRVSPTGVKFALGITAAALLLVGCGNTSTSTAQASHAPSPSHNQVAKVITYAKCKRAVAPLLKAEQQMNARLGVGMQFADYTSRLGDVSVAFTHAVTALKSSTDRGCVNGVGLPLQRAIRDYKAAGTTWNHCITTLDCTFAAGSAELKSAQAKWAAAANAIDSAQTHLTALKP